MKILISTQLMDAHSLAVANALENYAKVYIHYVNGKLGDERVSLRYKHDCVKFTFLDSRFGRTLEFAGENDLDIYWARRFPKKNVVDMVHKDDKEFVFNENTLFEKSISSLVSVIAKKTINSYYKGMMAEDKSVQLYFAMKVGLKIPATLLSNEKNHISNFLNFHDSIYKTFYPHTWSYKTHSKTIYATPISDEELLDDVATALTPGIYQQRVHAQFDVRVNIFGSKIVAVRLDTINKNVIDWKNEKNKYSLRQIELPQDIQLKCIALLELIGLEMGILDFIVTGEQWYFLEINPMGQFLWIEEQNPEIQLLSHFCEFLTGIPAKSFKNFSDTLPYVNNELTKEKAIFDEITSTTY